GMLGGVLAAIATRPLYGFLYDRAVAAASTIDSLVAYLVLFVLLVAATFLSGALAGLLAAFPWLAAARWLAGEQAGIVRWALVWPLGGAMIWSGLALSQAVSPLDTEPLWWWLPLGAALGVLVGTRIRQRPEHAG
ncbi:MAG TPA: hypothetical protein VFT99_05270, partial [Roseiflexaceae bacterium]|nr:hypothetical protein [Roseiflexaceae bacterium]